AGRAPFRSAERTTPSTSRQYDSSLALSASPKRKACSALAAISVAPINAAASLHDSAMGSTILDCLAMADSFGWVLLPTRRGGMPKAAAVMKPCIEEPI